MNSRLLRVLIVDDSALFRQAISKALREVPDVEVVGVAKNGEEAISRISELSPDLLTLDVEMPVMNGIETLREMNRKKLAAGAIMVSSVTLVGAQVTLDALFEGAFDFITKPTGGLYESHNELTASLTEEFRAYRQYRQDLRWKPNATAARQPVGQTNRQVASSTVEGTIPTTTHCDAVIIGASTGGPKALRHVLPRLDAEFPVPVILVQHMPIGYTTMMAQRLNEECPLDVVEARDGMRIEPGKIFIAPGGKHLALNRRQDTVIAKLMTDAPVNSCRPSVDFTIHSAVDVWQGNLLAVVMTGMGKDGLNGCQSLKSTGGTVFVQDAASSAVYGMPKAIADAKIADRELPLGRISAAITRHVNRYRRSG